MLEFRVRARVMVKFRATVQTPGVRNALVRCRAFYCICVDACNKVK